MAKAASELEVLSPEAEEIIDAEIETSLVKQNVTEALLSRLEKEYGGLKIKGPEDKEGYLTVQSARKDCKQVRVLISKICKAGRAKANAEAKKWVNRENELTDRVSKVEDPLETMEEDYEKEKQAVKDREAARIEQQGIARTTDMVKFGASLEGSNWVLGPVSYEAALVKQSDSEIYQDIYAQFKAQFEENEKERMVKEESQRQDREKLQKDQEDLKRQQQEARNMRTEGRVSLLTSLGMGAILSHNEEAFAYGDVRIWLRDVEERDGPDWEEIVSTAKEGIEKVKKAAEEADRVREIFRERLPRLKEWSSNGHYVYAKGKTWGEVKDLASLSDDDFEKLVGENNQYLKEREAEKERIRKEELENARLEGIGKSRRSMLASIEESYENSNKELGELSDGQWELNYQTLKSEYDKKQKRLSDLKQQEEQELLGEKQKYELLVKAIRAIHIPNFKSGQYRAKGNIIRDFIDGLK